VETGGERLRLVFRGRLETRDLEPFWRRFQLGAKQVFEAGNEKLKKEWRIRLNLTRREPGPRPIVTTTGAILMASSRRVGSRETT